MIKHGDDGTDRNITKCGIHLNALPIAECIAECWDNVTCQECLDARDS